jgi:DNA-binding NtrC family response regulator
LPPLRERSGDVRLLAQEFLRRYASEQNKELDGFDDGALEFMETYTWPGNVRELKNAIERAVILAKGNRIGVADLQPKQLALAEQEVRIPLGTTLEETQRLVTLKTFAFTGGDHRKTAVILGLEEEQLRRRLRTLLDVEEPVAV